MEELSDTALRVYLHLLRSGKPQGVRDIARDLGVPASTVHYNLRRLKDLGLVSEDADGYVVARVVAPEGFVVVGRRVVPRLLVYSSFFGGIAVGEIAVVLLRGLTADRALVLAVSALASAILLLEGLAMRPRRLGRSSRPPQ